MELEHFGAYLKRGREARGISIAELSRATKIKEQSLELLEDARIDALPAAVFVRGFVCAYAREVGLDVGEALARLRRVMPPVDAPLPPLPIPPPPVDASPHQSEGRRRVGVALVVLLILVVATLTLSLLLRHGRAGDGISERALPIQHVEV
ncbi:MAG TPA: helix-turn-helix domain-containing protein [Polyangia bacterium]|nr:helix-turn-helix domain-containing protein [Polyangia bacterium]